jgi:hypothetical protein
MAELRDKHGWSQRQIAEATNVPQATINRWLQAWDEQKKAGAIQVDRLTPSSEHARSAEGISVEALLARSVRGPKNSTPLAAAELRGWLLERGLAELRAGLLTPTALAVEIAEGLEIAV